MVMEILCSGSHFGSLQSEDSPQMFLMYRNGEFQGAKVYGILRKYPR